MILLVTLLSGCFDLEDVGAYSCDEYCDQVVSKTEECAQVAVQEQCEAEGGTNCDQMTEEQLSAYAAEGREDWAGSSRAEMVSSCNSDIEEAQKKDSACQAETATINNLTCDQILDLLGEIADAAQ